MSLFAEKACAVKDAIGATGVDFLESIDESIRGIQSGLVDGGKVLIFGNGGSAADAQHFAAELVSSLHGAPLPSPLAAVALTTDTSVLTAIGNDFDFKDVFARQVNALGSEKDVVIGLSTSGRSQNVLEGLRMAGQIGARTVAITGERGLSEPLSNIKIRVPSEDTQVVQTITLVVLHTICEGLEKLRWDLVQ